MHDDLIKNGYEKMIYNDYIESKKREIKILFGVTDFDCAKYVTEEIVHFFLYNKKDGQKFITQSEMNDIIENNKKYIPDDIQKYIYYNFTDRDYELIAFKKKKGPFRFLFNDYDYKYNESVFTETSNIITKDYITGLIWTTDWYFNRMMDPQSTTHISTWYYKHHQTPW